MSQPEWINEKIAAEMTGLAVQTFRNWRHWGKGPAYSKVGRSVRYALRDVQNYFQSRRIDPESRG